MLCIPPFSSSTSPLPSRLIKILSEYVLGTAESYIFCHYGLKIAQRICLGLNTTVTGLRGIDYKVGTEELIQI